MRNRDRDQTIPIAEEELVVEKKQIRDGDVTVRVRTDRFEEAKDVFLESGEVNVKRIPFDVIVDEVPVTRTEGDLTIVPILEERLVIEKRLVLVEEIHIRRTTTSRTERVNAVLRKQRATVERTDNAAKEK